MILCWADFDCFLANFGFIFGVRLGPRLAQEAPRWTQEGHQEPQSTEKNIYKNCNLPYATNHTFRVIEAPKTFIRGSGRLPKWHLKSSNTSKKASENGLGNYDLLDQFWNRFGIQNKPQNGSKTGQQMEPRISKQMLCMRRGGGWRKVLQGIAVAAGAKAVSEMEGIFIFLVWASGRFATRFGMMLSCDSFCLYCFY